MGIANLLFMNNKYIKTNLSSVFSHDRNTENLYSYISLSLSDDYEYSVI